MMSAATSLSPDESPVQQAPNAGVPPEHGPAHVVAPNSGGRRPVEIPIRQAPSTVGSPEELSDQQSLNSSDWRDEGPDRRVPPNPRGRPRPPARCRPPARRRPRERDSRLGVPSWFELLGFLFLSYNTGMAIYQSRGDVAAIASHVSTYLNIVSLFVSLKWYQRAPAGSAEKRKYMTSSWLLTMTLIFGYAYQGFGTSAKTLQVAFLHWVMTAATGIAPYILLFQMERSDPPLEEESLAV